MKKSSYRNYYNDFDSSLGYLFSLVTPIAVSLIMTAILGAISDSYGLSSFTQNPVMYVVYLAVGSLSLLALFFIYNRVCKINFKNASLFKFKFGWMNLLICIFIALITLFGFNQLINYIFYLLKTIGYNPDASMPLPLKNAGAGWLIINIFVLAVIPAICEEVIYRGIILNGFRRFGAINAVLLSALFFALAHGSAMQFFYQFILGIVLGFVVIKTGSIFAGMIVHFINNMTVVVYNYIMPTTSEPVYTTFNILMAFTFAIASVGILLLLIRLLKETKVNRSGYEQLYTKKEKKFSGVQSRVVFYIACAVAVALWAIGTFVT